MCDGEAVGRFSGVARERLSVSGEPHHLRNEGSKGADENGIAKKFEQGGEKSEKCHTFLSEK